MKAAAIPLDENLRLDALYRYDILDSERESIFDDVTQLAADICGAPIALISLVDQSRQWFKSHIGLDATETARNVSFCAHAILQPGLFVVPDTLKDDRFSDNSLVTGPPYIRFYAGAPMFTEEGYGLGTLCVIDQEPRELTPRQQKTLMVLRTHIMKLLELRRKTHELAEANRELEMYSYTVSHDLRAPLRAITGFCEIMKEDHTQELGEGARELVERVLKASYRMDQLTNDLLNLSRLSNLALTIRRVNLSKITHAVMTELQKADPDRHADVIIQPDLKVLGDEGLLRIVMENLLGNAWKYTSQCPQTRIEFGKETNHGKSEYFVRDNGVGFEMAYADKLFQPFQRLHASADYPGTGIGLATARRIIKRHGGSIRAESIVHHGTTIYFTLRSEEDEP